jgi:hypothetical protein
MQGMSEEQRWLMEQHHKGLHIGFEAIIGYAREALKSVILINGSAAAAILALISQVAKSSPGVVPALSLAIMWFGGGVLLGAAATGCSYVSQMLFNSSGRALLRNEMAQGLSNAATIAQLLAMLFFVLALVAFAWGGWTAAAALAIFDWSQGPAPGACLSV